MRLMIVEDDDQLLGILEHHLSRAGYDVRTATNGRAALAVLEETPVEIVVTDWMMPEMTGIELCRAIRKSDCLRSTYIIMLTGQVSAEEHIEGIHAGADDYLTKPFKMDRLLASIRTAMQLIGHAA
jgi:DNA-binding response OmpR family regulator